MAGKTEKTSNSVKWRIYGYVTDVRKAAEYAAGKEGRYLRYQTRGTCSTAIDLEIENDVITHCQFTNGCRGNTQGLAKMVEGQNAKDVMNRLRGIQCRGNTSCPDQLSRALEQYYQQHAE